MTINLLDLFRERAARQPDQPAVLGPRVGETLTYRQLDAEIRSAAEPLSRAGLQPGQCVGLHVPSGKQYIILNYAVWSQGGCVVPIPVELTDVEKRELAREIALDLVIDGPATARGNGAHRSSFLAGVAGDAMHIAPGFAAWRTKNPRPHPPGFHELNAAFIRFTSGTTGSSKGVVLSHQSIYERIHAANAVLELGPADRVIWLLSMSYHFAVSIVGYLTFGAGIVLPPNALGPTVLRATREFGGTFLYASPLHYSLMAAVPDAPRLPAVRLAVSTAVPLEREIAEAFRTKFALPLTQALGIIEVGLPAMNVDFAAEHPDAVGRVLPAYRLKLADTAMTAEWPEICFQGPGFLDAYYSPWRTRAEILPDGWFHTGDVGQVDTGGCLFIRGRSKDVINVAGMKFFPQELERVLEAHPAVQEACVVKRPDARFGEVPHAVVVARNDGRPPPSDSDLLNYCRQSLADFKVPRTLEFVERLPRTASGKLLRRAEAVTR